MGKYRTTPVASSTMPKGIPYIIGNEAAERFSFYGMRSILTVYMTKHLVDSAGNPDYMNEAESKGMFHLFVFASYFFPIVGSLLSDIVWGKYRTIIILSLGYCIGHACLAMGDTGIGTGILEPRSWLFVGLLFISMGAGGIKPCVSAHVGDQFSKTNQHLLPRVFSWFYFSINVGSATSQLLIPVLLAKFGPWLAFGLPGILMAAATFVFWLGRNRFVHIPPGGPSHFMAETLGPDGRRALLNLAPIFLIFVPMFWAIFDQTGSAWVIQARSMDRTFLGIEWLESQIQAANPILILILIPLFSYVLYPSIDKVFPLTPLRKISIGLFLTAVAFGITGWVETRISAGEQPNIQWQLLAYVVLTAAEVMVSITALEFAYTQAPKKMKSFIMGVYFLGVALGNLFTSAVNFLIDKGDGTSRLEGASYYWFFTGLMLAVAIGFVFMAKIYRGETYIHESEDEAV